MNIKLSDDIKNAFINAEYHDKGILIDKYLKPSNEESVANAEISTPFKTRREMLDKVDKAFWTNRNHKVLEPCCGKGGFVIDIIMKFMDGLKSVIHRRNTRYKHIVENMLYFSDINSNNIMICKWLIDPYNQYKLNYNTGDSLKLDIKDKWNIEGFNAVINNPPYNIANQRATGNSLWPNFTKKSLNEWIAPNGYLVSIHPNGWRKPNTPRCKMFGLQKLMTKDNQMEYLSMHNNKEGKQTFNCAIKYDWYVIKKTISYKSTTIRDYENKISEIDLREIEWIPNMKIEYVNSLMAKEGEEKMNMIHTIQCKRACSDKPSDIFIYKNIHSMTKNGIHYKYSDHNYGIGLPKVMISRSNYRYSINDFEGKLGMTQNIIAFSVKTQKDADDLCKAIKGDKFINYVTNICSFSIFQIDRYIFNQLKYGFWNDL